MGEWKSVPLEDKTELKREFLSIYKETLEWLGEEYDPDLFSADEITFQDPGEQLTGVL